MKTYKPPYPPVEIEEKDRVTEHGYITDCRPTQGNCTRCIHRYAGFDSAACDFCFSSAETDGIMNRRYFSNKK